MPTPRATAGLLSFLVSVAVSAADIEAQVSTPSADSLPPPAYSVGAAYDVKRECLVIFGGLRPSAGYSGQTWEWSKTGWRRIAVDGPSPRNSPTMAFDERRGTVVLFGGDDRAGPKGDTWEWNGRAWTRVAAPAAGPGARTNARLVYDAKRGTTVLFGGIAGQTVLGETWEWDGAVWTPVAAGGPPRFLHGVAADELRDALVTFGGSATPPSADPPPPEGGTWLLEQGSWRLWTGTGPSARDHVTLAYDAARGRTVLYGGNVDGERSAETWEWDGETWTLALARGALGPRSYPVMVFDPQRRRVLLYGGFDDSGPHNDLWEWDGRDWRRVA